MKELEQLQNLREAIQQRDYALASAIVTPLCRGDASGRMLPLLTSLVTAQVVALPKSAQTSIIKHFVDNLPCDITTLPAQAVLPLADLYLVGGLRQEASELCLRLLEKDPTFLPAAHRLGLCELSRAVTTPLRNTRVVAQRWRRALAYLSLAVEDNTYFRNWTAERFRTYAIEYTEQASVDADRRIVKRLRELVSHHAELAENENIPDTAAALRAVAVELDVDVAAIRALSEAVANGIQPSSATPVSFGRLWLDVMDSPRNAREFLSDVIRRFALLPRNTDSVESFAPTHGINVRQWFSRLAPIRHSLQWGQLNAAEQALGDICGASDECQVNERPALTQMAGSPKCCSPNCPSFATCNPGYSGNPGAALEMETDAHRIAVHIQLARAEQYALASPPRFLEAAQHWVRGRTLARAVGDSGQFEEDVAAQVMSLLEHHRGNPEVSTELMERAMAAVPGSSIRGRFADLLMSRGIERCNDDRWPEGADDLRWALRLNPYSERAHRNFGAALRNLAMQYFVGNNIRLAYSTAQELRELAEAAIRNSRTTDETELLLEWSRERLQEWEPLKDRVGDMQLNALMQNLMQRLNH